MRPYEIEVIEGLSYYIYDNELTVQLRGEYFTMSPSTTFWGGSPIATAKWLLKQLEEQFGDLQPTPEVVRLVKLLFEYLPAD